MRRPLTVAGLVLGFGLGGFFDGILLHQLLQWHHFVSGVVPSSTLTGLEINTLWDGIFHSAMYVVTAVGLILLWRAITRPDVPASPQTILGAVLFGFGVFHLFDSVLNHWLLGIHHIRMSPDWLAYDLVYFGIGLGLMALGSALMRRARQRVP